MITSSPINYYWKTAKDEDGRWRVSRYASNDFLESNPVESHYFLTPEFAGIMLRFCQNIEKPPAILYITNSLLVSNGSGGFNTVASRNLSNLTTSIKVSGRKVIELDQNNNLVTFDLPFLVLQWFRLAFLEKAVNFTKKIIWGERGRKSHH